MADQPDEPRDEAAPEPAPATFGVAETDEARIQELNDKLLRALADAENARKRADRARQEGRDAGIADVTAGLIPALDSLALAIDVAKQNDGDIEHYVSALVDGLHATSRAFIDALSRFGVAQIAPGKGAAFDPNFHEAVATAPDETVGPGHVIKTLQSGYMVGTRLIRPARVVLAADRQAEGAATDR